MLIPFDNGGLLMAAENQCLGYLLVCEGKGVFDAAVGAVQCTPEQAVTHNATLSKMYLAGLDKNCAIGQGADFYYDEVTGRVTTWPGDLVGTAEPRRQYPQSVTFTRGGMRLRGKLCKGANCVFFRRVA